MVEEVALPTRASRRSNRRSRRRGSLVIEVLGEVFITAGVLVLLFLGWQLWWTDVTAGQTQADAVTEIEKQWRQLPPSTEPSTKPVGPPIEGAVFAIVRIPRFGESYARPILEGTTRDILSKGVGHYQNTANPGEIGNFAVAGHRTTYAKPFNRIDELRVGDTIVVETATTYFVYAVETSEIVKPTDVGVIAPVPDKAGTAPTQAWMTMTSCHPEYSARQRFVVHSLLVKSYPRAEGLPAGTLNPPKA